MLGTVIKPNTAMTKCLVKLDNGKIEIFTYGQLVKQKGQYQTFSEWYHSIPVIDRPQFTDKLNNDGKYRIVYSSDPALWQLSDYKVSSQLGDNLVHLVSKTCQFKS